MKIENIINAHSLFSAKKDVRYYLNSIAFAFDENGKISHIASTCGHTLALSTVDDHEKAKVDQWVLLSSEHIKSFLAWNFDKKLHELNRESFKSEWLIDGRYPDIYRVMSKGEQSGNLEIGFNADYLSRISAFNKRMIKGNKLSASEKKISAMFRFNFTDSTSPVQASKTYNYDDDHLSYSLLTKIIIMPTRL